MKFVKFFSYSLLFVSCLNAQQPNVYQAQPATVYPAMAGSQSPQQQQTIAQQQTQQSLSQTSLSVTKSNNIFLEYYARQGESFSSSVFYNENGSLVKRELSYDSLHRAIVIFFGDWCPHCQTFLTNFSKYIPSLTSKGVNIIFVSVPSIEVLKNWRDPDLQNYETSKMKLNSFGINLSSKAQLTLLGDKVNLSRAGIQGLPVILAIKDSKEYYRGVGGQILEKLKLGNPDIMKQFLEIWKNPDDMEEQSTVEPSKPTKKKVSSHKKPSHKKSAKLFKKSKKLSSKVRLDSKSAKSAKMATEILNSTDWKFDMNLLGGIKTKSGASKLR